MIFVCSQILAIVCYIFEENS